MIKNIDLDEQTRLLNSVKKQLDLIGKYCPSLASRISFISILKLLEELIEKLKRDKPKKKKVDPKTHADIIVNLLDEAVKRK